MTDTPQPIRASNLAQLSGITHGFFSRVGGVSTGIYAGLNVGFGSNDDRAAVSENRKRVAASLGFPESAITTLHQVHSATALFIDAPITDQPPRADAIVTATPGVIVGALAADCTPVLFADTETQMVAAAHAGWRGALGGVLEATVETMIAHGARAATIHAAIGPTINQAAYEVGPEFEAAFLEKRPDAARFFAVPDEGSKAHFDLPGFIEWRLDRLGLASCERQTLCTYENERLFYSYRRATHRVEQDYGRQISAIVVS